MKILTWNLGLYPWLLFLSPVGLVRIGGSWTQDNGYCVGNELAILGVVDEQDPDVVVFQEIQDPERSPRLVRYPYVAWCKSPTHSHGRMVYSKIPFTEIHHTNTELPVWEIEFADWSLFPVHFSHISPNKRHLEAQSILHCAKKSDVSIIVGDTNLYGWPDREICFPSDWQTYTLLRKSMEHVGDESPTWVSCFCLDRAYARGVQTHKTVLPRVGTYMDHNPVVIEY